MNKVYIIYYESMEPDDYGIGSIPEKETYFYKCVSSEKRAKEIVEERNQLEENSHYPDKYFYKEILVED